MKPLIGIIDIGACNRGSVDSALARAGAEVTTVSDARNVRSCDALVLPGVANFGFVAQQLDRRQLRAPLSAAVTDGMPLLGICAGFQVLFEASEESPLRRGLGLFSGRVRRLETPRVPHMGWNRVHPVRNSGALEGWAYFANSFAPDECVADAAAVTCEGGVVFASIARRGTALGVQFHPERSGTYGAAVLKTFVASATVSYAR